MSRIKNIIAKFIAAVQATPPDAPRPGSIPLPPTGRPRQPPTGPTNTPAQPPNPPTPSPSPHRPQFTMCPDEIMGEWPPRVPDGNTSTANQCKKIQTHFAQLRKHLKECASKCGSDNGVNYDWTTCLNNKWNEWIIDQPTASIAPVDMTGVMAAVPFQMPESPIPQDETPFPLKPNLSGTELRNCKIHRNRCACNVRRKKLEHVLKLAELAEKYYWMCPPYNKDDAKTRFKNACEALKMEKPASDTCSPNADFGDECRKYCRNCV